jgi:hypothetical protein
MTEDEKDFREAIRNAVEYDESGKRYVSSNLPSFEDGDAFDHWCGCFEESVEANIDHEGWQEGYDY